MAAAAIAKSTGTPATAQRMQRMRVLGGCNGRRFQQHWYIQVRALKTCGHGRQVPHRAEPRRSRLGAASESSRPAGDQDAACPSQPRRSAQWPLPVAVLPPYPAARPRARAERLGARPRRSFRWVRRLVAGFAAPDRDRPAGAPGRTAHGGFALAADSDRPERIMPTLQPLPGPARADSDF